jgi:leucyl-tRNA synthetase
VTQNNIATSRKQLKMLGYSFDWDREINTTDPSYYKWTQWIFLQLFKHGLAYKTRNAGQLVHVLQVRARQRGGRERRVRALRREVVRKEKSQWMLKITAYAEQLIDDLDDVDFIERVKIQQKNWIGRSTARRSFRHHRGDKLTVYTTRCDTLFGATYMVISPEHAMSRVAGRIKSKTADEVAAYQRRGRARKSDFERTELNKEKTGVELEGVAASTPSTAARSRSSSPTTCSSTYGTGAIMAVPAHDDRDWEFAKKFGCRSSRSSRAAIEKAPSPTGRHRHDGQLRLPQRHDRGGGQEEDDRSGSAKRASASERSTTSCATGCSPASATGASRSRWSTAKSAAGCPCPRISCRCCCRTSRRTTSRPTTANRPLAQDDRLGQHHLPALRRPRQARDRHHAPVGRLVWYFLRYMDPHNDKALASPRRWNTGLPVDWYNGGMEHTTLHLLYSRSGISSSTTSASCRRRSRTRSAPATA